ncbi:hemolysin, partial [Bacillus toyonensis]
MKKKPYKILAVSAFLIMTTTYALTPIATFAIETEQTNTGDM